MKPARIKIAADRDVCIGAGMCVMTAPELFDQDDDGIVVLLEAAQMTVDGVPAEHADAAVRAVANAIRTAYQKSIDGPAWRHARGRSDRRLARVDVK